MENSIFCSADKGMEYFTLKKNSESLEPYLFFAQIIVENLSPLRSPLRQLC